MELKTPKRYYEVLAEYYVMHPEKADTLHQIEIDTLWDNNQYKIISGLITYLWVFSHCLKRKYYNNLIQTANKLFVLDVEHSTKRFQPVYDYLYKNILSSPTLWNSTEVQRLVLDIFSLVSKYYFYYNSTETAAGLQDFLGQTQAALTAFKDKLEYPKGHTKIHTLNMFVNEVVRQLKSSKNERTILIYLEKLQLFSGDLEIPGTKTKINLRTVLLDYSTPGLPYYPTRKMRDQAKKAIDLLFPEGKITRQATNWFFRFLSPVDLLRSWWYWIFSWLTGLLLLLQHKGSYQEKGAIHVVPLDELENELVKGAYTTENEKDK
uniref:Uncharacterized protein n=1 Tax=Arcella intermedia TaxID=1963864 RepID=A0A6B2L8L7_9EUKA